MVSRCRSASLRTLIALLICLALVASAFAPFAIAKANGFSWAGQGQSRRPTPTPGPPEVNLPNLNEARHRRPERLDAPAPIPSMMRSRRNPLAPRNGRRVGDPLPPASQGAANNTGKGSEQVDTGRRQSRGSHSLQSLPAIHSHHARSRGAANPLANARGIAFPSLLDSQFLPNFFPALADYAVFDPVFRAAVFLLYPLAAPPQAPSPRIAFASNREGSAQIYLMNTDGSNQTRLTISAANDESPQWSPDNSRILFQSDRDNPFSCLSEIYVMNAAGSSQTRLTNDAADDSAPVWSPDGTEIIFQSARNGLYYQVYVMNADWDRPD